MGKYRRPAHSIVEEPKFFIKHWWHLLYQWTKAHSDQVLTGLLAVLVVVLVLVLWGRYRTSANVEAWERFSGSEGPAALEAAAENYVGTTAGPYLSLKLADYYFESGRAEDAARLYGGVAQSPDVQVAERARFSLAKANAALGRFDDAVSAYTELDAGGGFWGGEAERAIEAVRETREVYDHFADLKKTALEAEAAAQAAAARQAASGEGEGQPAELAEGEGATEAAALTPAEGTDAAGVSGESTEAGEGELQTEAVPAAESGQADEVDAATAAD